MQGIRDGIAVRAAPEESKDTVDTDVSDRDTTHHYLRDL